MERKQTKPYRVIWLREGRVFDLDTALAVANHMFVHANFATKDYAIFKGERRWTKPVAGEVRELAAALEAWR